MKNELMIEKLQILADNLERRSNNCSILSEQTDSGFPQEHYIEKKGQSQAFQWSADEINWLIKSLR